MKRIPIAGPWITDKEIAYVNDAVTRGWYDGANMYQERFERAFAQYLGVKHAVCLPSCTSAIHLALAALGVGPGDEVVVPDITWIATAAPICYLGATPVFADIDPNTWCLSAESLEHVITPKTKAVIPVDLYGGMPNMDALLATAQRHGIAVVEDAAEAIGSTWKGKRAGSFGDAGVFSFHGSKTLTTGEGGMLVTNRDDVVRRALVLRDHGRQPGDQWFFNDEVGFKYRMSGMQAALGLAQLERIEELLARKREQFAWYCEDLADVAGLTLNPQPEHLKNTYWMVTIVVDKIAGWSKEELHRRLGRHGIATRPFFHPLSSIPAFRDTRQARLAQERNQEAYAISQYGLNLPSALALNREDVSHVCRVLREVLASPPMRPSALGEPQEVTGRMEMQDLR